MVVSFDSPDRFYKALGNHGDYADTPVRSPLLRCTAPVLA